MALKRYAEGFFRPEGKFFRRSNFSLEYGVTIVNVEQLLHEALDAFNNGETIDGVEPEVEHSPKLDHDDVPISRGNTLIDQKGIFQPRLCASPETKRFPSLFFGNYFLNEDDRDLFDLFKKNAQCPQMFSMNLNAKKRKTKKAKKKKKIRSKRSGFSVLQRNENNAFLDSFRLELHRSSARSSTDDDESDRFDSDRTVAQKNDAVLDKLSDRAKLGSIIVHSMKLGEALSDRMAVQLIVERLR